MTKLDYWRFAVEVAFLGAFLCQIMVNRYIVKIVEALLKRIEALERRND